MQNNINQVACVGSGLIGQGWATLFASAGFNVFMQDLSDRKLEAATGQVLQNLMHLEDSGRLRDMTAAMAFDHIRTTLSLAEAVRDTDYIVESVPDTYADKKPVFKEMDSLAPGDTIIGSSSSGLLMSEIQSGLTRPGRCVLIHPFLPVHLLPLVEVVGGNQTETQAVDITCRLMQEIGKTPVRLKKEVSGYIVNRLQAALLREAVDLVASGVADAEEVDQAFCTSMGMRDSFIGPLLRAYLAGDGIENFIEHYSESYRLRWESMATWNSMSPPVKECLINSVNDMTIVRDNSLAKIKAWRDRLLMEILKVDRTCR